MDLTNIRADNHLHADTPNRYSLEDKNFWNLPAMGFRSLLNVPASTDTDDTK